MIIATVITCPQRWKHYQNFRRNFATLGFPFPLRTFQTSQCLHITYANNNLNSRAALAYCDYHLPDAANSWVLYLEDDVVLKPALAALLSELIDVGVAEAVDCWYLCNRKNAVKHQRRIGPLLVNELSYPVHGGHGLMLPKRHLKRILTSHWSDVSDHAIFAAINHPKLKIFQIIDPVLVEHIGELSTYDPNNRKKLEVNYAN